MTVEESEARTRWEENQRSLWGQRPREWADIAEPQNRAVIDSALEAGGVSDGTALLDIGCGAGLGLTLAHDRGASVAGLDIAAGYLAIAAERVPSADLREGGLDELPFDDDAFDVVLAVNALQFAYDANRALGEVARVLRPGGRLVVLQFAAPERCEATALHDAMQTLIPPERHEDHAPYALAGPGAMEAALEQAGLKIEQDRELPGDWHYPDEETALAALLCSGGGTRAMRIAGEDSTRAALSRGFAPFRQDDGSFLMHNHFRLLIADLPG